MNIYIYTYIQIEDVSIGQVYMHSMVRSLKTADLHNGYFKLPKADPYTLHDLRHIKPFALTFFHDFHVKDLHISPYI